MGPYSWERTIVAILQEDTEVTKEKQQSPRTPRNRRKSDYGVRSVHKGMCWYLNPEVDG